MAAPTRSKGQRQRVIILGGGLGGLSAAWELSQPGVGHRYEIVVYQQGWRLGGKGASSRNAAHDNRIEEHGLHIWLGFYENAFRMLRECYEQVRPTAFPTVWHAFEPASHFVLEEDRPDGWISWDDVFPEQLPGRPGEGGALPSPWQQLVRALELSVSYLISAARTPPEVNPKGSLSMRPAPAASASASLSASAKSATEPLDVKLAHQLAAAALALPGSVLQHPAATAAGLSGDVLLAAAVGLAAALPDDVSLHSAEHHGFLLRCVERASQWAHEKILPLVKANDARRRDWYLADILLACAHGILHDKVLQRGFGAIDDEDFRQWLHSHGADRETVECSLVRTVAYDLQFAYQNGDPATPRCSAATALQGLFRLFLTYRGAIAWKMRAGMGEVVFAPLYQALYDRGVRFEFFHQVKSLRLTPRHGSAGRRVASISMLIQADPAKTAPGTTKDGEYLPLETIVTANGAVLDCWPAEPRFTVPEGLEPERLESYWCSTGKEWELKLRDDDEVILAIPVGAQRGALCAELRDDQPDRWGRMLDRMGVIWTQSLQLWFIKSQEDLGWAWGNGTLGGYVEAFDTCADMSQLIAIEDKKRTGIKAIAYLCNAMPTPAWNDTVDYADQARKATKLVRDTAAQFLRNDAGPIWPRAVDRYPSDFKWQHLYAPQGGKGEVRLDAQFVRANSDPSEGYVLPLPGTWSVRLKPGDSGYANLKLAGDWTDCVINAGCVEAAVMSGMLAAQAISCSPSDDRIVGYHRAAGV